MTQLSSQILAILKAAGKRVVMISVTWTTLLACFILTILFFGFIGLFFVSSEPEYETNYDVVYGYGSNELLSIKVTGPIAGTDDSSTLDPFSDMYVAGYQIKEQLQAAADDDLIAGVVLEINSPGGTIYGARAIADGITYYQEQTDKPVVAYVEGMAASGGYWAASAADLIIADHGSDVGSIGVIMGPFQYYNQLLGEDGGLLSGGVITERGIESTYITAGKSKDMGSPYRRLTADELTVLQKSVNNEYDNFVAYVSKARDIPEDTIRNTIGALAYDNKTAHEYKLIDATGSRDAAYAELAKLAKVENDFQVIREAYEPSFMESLLFSRLRSPQKQAKSFDLCTLTRGSLVYHGDVSALCK